MVTWLGEPDAGQVAAAVRDWDEETVRAAELVALMQGLGPYLQETLPGTPIYAALPASFRQWLARDHDMNGARVQRLHDDLAAILHEANRAGVSVMPLKGSLLATGYYESPALRPMADLDILVRGDDVEIVVDVLEGLGYRRKPSPRRHTKELIFLNPGGERVVSQRQDHADNPRPVEVHVELTRSLWVEFGAFDLTDYLWAESQPGELLGERVWLPALDRFLTYLAAHDLYHHLFGTGRFIHLIDLTYVAPQVRQFEPPDANLVYPMLRLAARALPGRLPGVDLTTLADRTHPRLRRWADTAPLDGRCGLNVDPTPPGQKNRWRMRWVRWHPTPERLALAYGDVPLLWAYARHALTLVRQLGPGLANTDLLT